MDFDFFLVTIIFVIAVHIGCILFLLLKSGSKNIQERCVALYEKSQPSQNSWKQLMVATVIGDIVVTGVIASGFLIVAVIFGSGALSAYFLDSAAPGITGVLAGLLITPLVLRAASALK